MSSIRVHAVNGRCYSSAVIYSCFDDDGNGRLDQEELMHMLEAINESKGALFDGNYAKAMEAIKHADVYVH